MNRAYNNNDYLLPVNNAAFSTDNYFDDSSDNND